MTNILHITASANPGTSMTNKLADDFLGAFAEKTSISKTSRNVAEGLPFIDPTWVGANFTPEEDRSEEQKQALSLSDSLIEELESNDVIVFSLPIYNFGIPATIKAWVDMVARARKTFRYTENGPVGMLENKKAIMLVASGGTQVGSAIDFATPYMKHALGFIGITDIEIVAADAMAMKEESAEEASNKAKALGEKLGFQYSNTDQAAAS